MYVIVLAEKRIVFVLRSALYIVKFIKQCCMEQVIVFSDEWVIVFYSVFFLVIPLTIYLLAKFSE